MTAREIVRTLPGEQRDTLCDFLLALCMEVKLKDRTPEWRMACDECADQISYQLFTED